MVPNCRREADVVLTCRVLGHMHQDEIGSIRVINEKWHDTELVWEADEPHQCRKKDIYLAYYTNIHYDGICCVPDPVPGTQPEENLPSSDTTPQDQVEMRTTVTISHQSRGTTQDSAETMEQADCTQAMSGDDVTPVGSVDYQEDTTKENFTDRERIPQSSSKKRKAETDVRAKIKQIKPTYYPPGMEETPAGDKQQEKLNIYLDKANVAFKSAMWTITRKQRYIQVGACQNSFTDPDGPVDFFYYYRCEGGQIKMKFRSRIEVCKYLKNLMQKR